MKMKWRIIMISIFVMLILSCNQKDPSPINVDIFIDLRVYDKSGNNLLNSSNAGYYKPEDIRVYFLKDGVKTEVYNPALDGPRNFRIFNNGANQNFLRLTPSEGTKDQETTTTLLLWRQNDQDTIRTTMTRISGTVYCSKVSYNGAIKYDVSTSQTISWGTGSFRRLIDVQK